MLRIYLRSRRYRFSDKSIELLYVQGSWGYDCDMVVSVRIIILLCDPLKYMYWTELNTKCPRSSDPFSIVTYYIKLVTTSWTDGIYIFFSLHTRISNFVSYLIWAHICVVTDTLKCKFLNKYPRQYFFFFFFFFQLNYWNYTWSSEIMMFIISES